VSRRTSAAFLVTWLSLIVIPNPAARAMATSPTDVRIVFARLQESAPENYEIWTARAVTKFGSRTTP